MAQLVIAAAGAALGNLAFPGTILGLTGAQIGWTVGSLLAAPKAPHQRLEGPRLADLSMQSSTEGAALPKPFGRWRMAGNVIWATDLVETRTETHSGGGKGGGGGSTTVTWSYSASWAVALCEGPIVGVTKIWADSKLIYENGVSTALPDGVTVYTGTETQTADASIQADIGAADTPAFRGTAYIVFSGMQLADYGNRIPNISAEVITAATYDFASTRYAGVLPASYSVKPVYDAAHSVYVTIRTGNKAAVSADGISAFTEYSLPAGNNWAAIQTDGAGRLVAVSYNNDYASYSTDGGQTWSAAQTLYSVGGPLVMEYQGGNYIALQSGGSFTGYGTSPSGATGTWTSRTLPGGLSLNINSSACNGTTAIFIGNTSGGVSYALVTTDGGVTMTAYAIGVNGTYTGLAVKDGVWMACKQSSSTFIRSIDDGATWSSVTAPSNSTWTDMIADDRQFLAITSSTTAAISTTGASGDWTGKTLAASSAPSKGCARPGGGYLLLSGTATVKVDNDILAADTVLLSDIVTALAEEAGLASGDLDVADLTDAVDGYCRTGPMTARAAIEPLQGLYLFDAVESSGVMSFPKRGGASVVTISSDDLVRASAEADVIEITRGQDLELPNEIALKFADVDRDHQPGTVYARRLAVAAQGKQMTEIPVLAGSDTLQQSAEILLRNAWRERTRYRFALGPEYLYLDPTDVITLSRDGVSHILRLTSMSAAPIGAIDCEAVAEDIGAYTSTATATDDTWVAPTPVAALGDTTGIVLDLPALRDADGLTPTVYLAAAGEPDLRWTSGIAYKSSDGGATYTLQQALGIPSVIGTTSTTLGNGRAGIMDEINSVTFTNESPDTTLASVAWATLLAGGNAFAIGAAGRWEIVQAMTVTEVSAGVYKLTRLLRGRKGTEAAMSQHTSSDTVVALTSGALLPQSIPAADIGVARDWKFVTSGASVDAAAATAYTASNAGLKPYSPVHLGGGRDASGNLTLAWLRRDRLDNQWRGNATVPMSEASEAYEIDIYDDGTYTTVVRTISATAETAEYSAADQTTDLGAPAATVYCKVYQISAAVGRGDALTGSV